MKDLTLFFIHAFKTAFSSVGNKGGFLFEILIQDIGDFLGSEVNFLTRRRYPCFISGSFFKEIGSPGDSIRDDYLRTLSIANFKVEL